jgi:orotidine-5'-phosphate decarboxylase
MTADARPASLVRPAPVAIALDTDDLATAVRWAEAVGPYVSTLKVGLQLYTRHGREVVQAVRSAGGRPVFLDLKLHDIPHTVAGAARAVADLEPAFVTVHAAGGPAMVEAAAQALPGSRIAAVTVLTSLSDADLARIGMAGPATEAVRRLALLAVDAGARALVCSPGEVGMLRETVGADIVLITPGVRPRPVDLAGAAESVDRGPSLARVAADEDDQARVGTPERALADGADLLVVGRPVTGTDDPAAAARALADSLSSAVPT